MPYVNYYKCLVLGKYMSSINYNKIYKNSVGVKNDMKTSLKSQIEERNFLCEEAFYFLDSDVLNGKIGIWK